jgi:hypothetical protein
VIKNSLCLASILAISSCVQVPDPVETSKNSKLSANDDRFSVATYAKNQQGKELNIFANDEFTSADAFTWSIIIEPSLGKLTVNNQNTDDVSDDTLQYIPDQGMQGIDTFTYKVIDSNSDTESEATVSISIYKINEAELSFTDDSNIHIDWKLNLTSEGPYLALQLNADGESDYIDVEDAEHLDISQNTFEISAKINDLNLIDGLYKLVLRDSDGIELDSITFPLSTLDADGDGVANQEDDLPLNKGETQDTDKDQIGNNEDSDDDNDGYQDADEIAAGSDPLDKTSKPADNDNDGISDVTDPDDDNDGVSDSEDKFPFDTTESFDNDEPTAANDLYTLSRNGSQELDVLDNDRFGSDGARSISIVSMPAKGTVSIDTHGTADVTDDTFQYTPSSNAAGNDSFTYQIVDNGGGNASSATVSLTFGQLTNVALEAGAIPGQVEISWSATGGADAYLSLLVNADGQSGYSPVNGTENIAVTKKSITLKAELLLYDWVNGSYLLELRDSQDNVIDSKTILLSTLDPETLVTVLYASHPNREDEFGNSISLSADGNTLAIGTPESRQVDNSLSQSGAVYIFTRNENTIWEQQAFLKVSNPNKILHFGHSLSLSSDGNTLAVGGFIFIRDSNNTWFEQAIVLPDAITSPVSLNASGDTVAIAKSETVTVFSRSSQNAWVKQGELKAKVADKGDKFGSSIQLNAAGDKIIIGAYGEDGDGYYGPDNNSTEDSGAAYIFSRNNSGSWNQDAYIKTDRTIKGSRFGSSVSINSVGDVIAVGAPKENNIGAAYVFSSDASGSWHQQTHIIPTHVNGQKLSTIYSFGDAISLSGDGKALAISDEGDGCLGNGMNACDKYSNEGSFVLYVYKGDVWQEQAYFKPSELKPHAFFGTSIDLSSDGSVLAVSASYGGTKLEGSVYLY